MSRCFSSVHWDKFFSLNVTADTMWDRVCDMLNMEQFVPASARYTERNNIQKEMKYYPCSMKRACTSTEDMLMRSGFRLILTAQ